MFYLWLKYRWIRGHLLIDERNLVLQGRGYTVETHYVEEPVTDYLQAAVNTVLIIHEKVSCFTL
jgi:hypothetical protein